MDVIISKEEYDYLKSCEDKLAKDEKFTIVYNGNTLYVVGSNEEAVNSVLEICSKEREEKEEIKRLFEKYMNLPFYKKILDKEYRLMIKERFNI